MELSGNFPSGPFIQPEAQVPPLDSTLSSLAVPGKPSTPPQKSLQLDNLAFLILFLNDVRLLRYSSLKEGFLRFFHLRVLTFFF